MTRRCETGASLRVAGGEGHVYNTRYFNAASELFGSLWIFLLSKKAPAWGCELARCAVSAYYFISFGAGPEPGIRIWSLLPFAPISDTSAERTPDRVWKPRIRSSARAFTLTRQDCVQGRNREACVAYDVRRREQSKIPNGFASKDPGYSQRPYQDDPGARLSPCVRVARRGLRSGLRARSNAPSSGANEERCCAPVSRRHAALEGVVHHSFGPAT